MKISTIILPSGATTVAALVGDRVLDLNAASGGELPPSMLAFLELGASGMAKAKALVEEAKSGREQSGLLKVSAVQLLAPIPRPGKIIHAACNFVSHLNELTTWKAPEWQAHNWGKFHYEHPTGFLQAPSSVVGEASRVVPPRFTQQLDFEVEMATVIGRRCKNVSVKEALEYVAGYMVFNDLSARDIQAREHANKVIMLGKSFDGSCPMGPWLTTRDEIPDPTVLGMKLIVNGEVRQNSSTTHMRYKPAELVSWWSQTTLEPGDVLTSGSPPGVAAGMEVPRWLKPGDRVEAVVDGLGTLTTHIVEAA